MGREQDRKQEGELDQPAGIPGRSHGSLKTGQEIAHPRDLWEVPSAPLERLFLESGRETQAVYIKGHFL